jgi:hypothetical protein
MDPIHIRPSAGCVASRPALLRNVSRSLQRRPGKINTQARSTLSCPLNPTLGSYFSMGAAKSIVLTIVRPGSRFRQPARNHGP